MNHVSKFLVLSLTFICLEQRAFSIQVVNEARSPSKSVDSAKIVERGGTVDIVSSDKKTIVIDGRSYVLAAASVVVHSESSKDIQRVGSIRPGTKVRFNTTKNNYAAQEQIVEIWIASQVKSLQFYK
jgi:uncharacterized protein YgiM (DUF1202 family)